MTEAEEIASGMGRTFAGAISQRVSAVMSRATGVEGSGSLPDWLVKANAEAKRRFDAVDWQQGKWYSIYDEDEGSPGTALFFKCEIDPQGDVYLVEDMCDYDRQGGHQPECFEALGYITSRSVVMPL